MFDDLFKSLRKFYSKIIHGIAFVPAVIGMAFLGLAIATVAWDIGGIDRWLSNNRLSWLTLRDAETARIVVSTVAGGIISLAVFSFSMVMVVMNQAASQMSNRVLDNIIGNKVQKTVLGFYIGTIIYALFLLTTISGSIEGATIPVLSIYILLCFTIVDIFLFIYFLHYITQSIRYEQLIKRVHDHTYKSLKGMCCDAIEVGSIKQYPCKEAVPAKQSGYYQGFAMSRLLELAKKHDITIRFLYPKGTYLLKYVRFLEIGSQHKLNPELIEKIFSAIDFFYGQEVDNTPYYGFRHLMEVGVKALSPGINDPGTAVLTLNALSNLLYYRMRCIIPDSFIDEEGTTRILTKELSFTNLFEMTILPIWDYGKKDRVVQLALIHIIDQLQQVDEKKLYTVLFETMLKEVNQAQTG